MAVTTPQQELKRLRSYLNPYIRGPNTTAILTALSTASAYLMNNAASVNNMLYIATSEGEYLDQRLANYGIVRPPQVGLSDSIFQDIGIQVKNRKQVRDLINNLLDSMFGDELVRANSASTVSEPYNLADGDTLIINFDDATTTTVTFSASQFQNISMALAQEVADAITTQLTILGVRGSAISNNNGNGNFVELISSTIGPASSVTVMGGSAQNELLFPASVAAGGNASTQWTLTLRPGGIVRFTWTGGANPNCGLVLPGDYVNIYGGGFTSSSNEGSYTIIHAVGGTVGSSYFDIENPLATSGIITQGIDDAILFFNPVRITLQSMYTYAAVYQTQNAILQVFLPATTQVIRRSRIGSAHLHEPPYVIYTFNAQPNLNDQFVLTTTNTLVAGTNFAIGMTVQQTMQNMAVAVNELTGLDATVGIAIGTTKPILTVFQDSPSLTLVGTYIGAANITSGGPQGDPISVQPNQQGPYMYDLTQPFTVSYISTTLTDELDGTKPQVFQVANASQFPNQQGYLIFGYGTAEQEGPVPYIGTPSDNTLLISPIYTIQTPHPAGSTVTLIAQNSAASLALDGSDYEFFITDVVSGRVYAQDLIQSVAATGIKVIFTILYPNDIGLGKWGTQYSEISYIYGP